MSNQGDMVQWEIYKQGEIIDIYFAPVGMSKKKVKKELVDQENYPGNIKLKKVK
ncbi:MAG: hypothetical protein ACOCUT_00160 [bacterium]